MRSPTYKLMPPTLQEWLPPKDLVWFVLDAVAQMDLVAFYQKYRQDGKGQAAFITRTGVFSKPILDKSDCDWCCNSARRKS